MTRFTDNWTSRQIIQPSLTTSNHHTAVLTVALLLLSSLPVFISCIIDNSYYHNEEGSGAPKTVKTILTFTPETGTMADGTLDIFFFNNDRLRKLDSYQRTQIHKDNIIEAASREGDKIIVVIANSHIKEEDCENIYDYADLSGLYAELKDERSDYPILCAETTVNAGHERRCAITLKPLMAQVKINSISCDFFNKPYSDAELTDVKIYLTNICSRYPIAGQQPSVPESIIDYGKFEPEDTSGFIDRHLFYQRLDSPLNASVIYPEIMLYCYQNIVEEEALGSPFTRLVIEGTLNGETTYYPINVNRGVWSSPDGKAGVSRNGCYVYDITISQRGVPSPDTPIEPGTVTCNFSITPWQEQDKRNVTF